MVEGRDTALKNQFITHWQEIDGGAWISSKEHLPTKEDADAYDCVISLNKWGEIAMAGWHRFEHEESLYFWQHAPQPPDNYRKLKERAR